MLTPIREDEEAAKAWLRGFPVEHRNALAQWFHQAVRSGGTLAENVLMLVGQKAKVKRGSPLSTEAEREFAAGVLLRLKEDREGALIYAKWVIGYEGLPAAEKARRKAESGEQHRLAYMENQPPTEKQLAFLTRLGCPEVPANRAEASRLIELWKEQG